MLQALSLAVSYDGEPLFSGVDLIINSGDRVGLVGPNGVGKSTLLRVLVGEERPSAGHVERTPGTTVGYFAQQIPDPASTVGEFLQAGLGEVATLDTQLAELAAQLSTGDTSRLAEYGSVQERWTVLSGWSLDTRLEQVRQRLDIAYLDDETRLVDLSGGEQARLTLAQVLLSQPDLLVLDEPTNHLDAEGSAWLGDWLAGYPGGVLVVSHDRAFLDRSVTRIVELDGIHDDLQTYPGGYTAYRAEKDGRWQRYLLDYEAQEKKRIRWEADIAATKEQARGVEAANPRNPTLRRYARKVARKAIVRERRLRRQFDSLRWLAQPQTRPRLTLAFPGHGDPGVVVRQVEALTVHIGDRLLLDRVDLAIRGGDRILLSGRNGAGKTTLLRHLAEGDDAYLLPQTHDPLRTGTTVLDFFRSRVAVYVDEAEALLDAYLFPAGTWDAPLRTLSAGELRRLLLAVMVNSGADLLLLDEPTNYLDFDALDVIEEALRGYRGTLVLVTHDAVFADRVGITRHWTLVDAQVSEARVTLTAAP